MLFIDEDAFADTDTSFEILVLPQLAEAIAIFG
jgi:hypothetical protein